MSADRALSRAIRRLLDQGGVEELPLYLDWLSLPLGRKCSQIVCRIRLRGHLKSS